MTPTKKRCKFCGAVITLVKVGTVPKWVIDPHRPDRWKCQPTRDFPLRSHEPTAEAVK